MLVKLPRTCARRTAVTYAKLLYRVLPGIGGMRFAGALVRPGASIEEAALWPGPEYPAVPVLLECAGALESGWGHRRMPLTYILWRYEPRGEGELAWRELARAASVGPEWADDLARAARRALAPLGPGQAAPDAWAISARVLAAIELAMADLDPGVEAEVMSLVYDQVAARVVRLSA